MRNNWDDRVEMEAQGSRELLAQMVEMLGRQRFIEIEGIEERVIPVEVESGFILDERDASSNHSLRLGFGS